MKGYNVGKKVLGIKLHIAVDTQRLPHAIAVTTAEVTDRLGALLVPGGCAAELRQMQCILAEAGTKANLSLRW
ncbi:Transposase DDE domain-containing protein [Nitrosomonas sp. Nm58]|nr:Transposase DDE domain-containing protein [Nitrosomonas sp. Nm58]